MEESGIKRSRWKPVGIGCLGVAAALIVAGLVAVIVKPWAPEMEVADPGPAGERIEDDGLVGNWYPGGPRSSAVLVLGGSEGGLGPRADAMGRSLHGAGHSVLVLSYFGAVDHQPQHLELVELELFDQAVAWLRARPEVDPQQVGVIGTSKGSEAALLLASSDPDIAAVAALVPSSVVWPGINQREPWEMIFGLDSSWSRGGESVPFLPYGEARGPDVFELYRTGLETVADHPEAVIPVEQITGPVLLVCGEQDTLWPSCPMAQQIEERITTNGGTAELLAYADAGHLGVGPPLDPGADAEALTELGGTAAGNASARADGWPQVLDFFRHALA
ncbi:acyl-CoA thioester hydrolase/BAAT C-terminal domain-containing protein [Parenemella sanctibonifatiensis]|nr:acyl-CoA thioester hydrolase/BAAT C-terminal domain-containing protein [Parenemella sanctibonifatiensis]